MPYISFKIKIIDFNCRFSKIFTNNTRKIDLACPCSYRIYVSLQGRLLGGLRVRITSDGKGRYTLLLRFPSFIILKQRVAAFYGRNVLLHNHSYSLCSTIWYHCSNNFLRGLKVRITANRKDWYTLLLKFLSLINLKQKMAVFVKGLFRFATIFTYRFAQHSYADNFQKKETSARLDPQVSFSKRYNQPMHRV